MCVTRKYLSWLDAVLRLVGFFGCLAFHCRLYQSEFVSYFWMISLPVSSTAQSLAGQWRRMESVQSPASDCALWKKILDKVAKTNSGLELI